MYTLHLKRNDKSLFEEVWRPNIRNLDHYQTSCKTHKTIPYKPLHKNTGQRGCGRNTGNPASTLSVQWRLVQEWTQSLPTSQIDCTNHRHLHKKKNGFLLNRQEFYPPQKNSSFSAEHLSPLFPASSIHHLIQEDRQLRHSTSTEVQLRCSWRKRPNSWLTKTFSNTSPSSQGPKLTSLSV